MEMAFNNEFCEMTVDEMQNVTGGFIIAVVAIGSATYTITSGGAAAAIAGAYGLGKAFGEIKKTFF